MALTFYIPVIDHIINVTAPEELEEGVTTLSQDPYLYSLRDIYRIFLLDFLT